VKEFKPAFPRARERAAVVTPPAAPAESCCVVVVVAASAVNASTTTVGAKRYGEAVAVAPWSKQHGRGFGRANQRVVVGCVHLRNLNRTMSTTMTVRLEDDVKDRLDVLAEATQRSKSFLAAEAIRAYVENNEWQIGEIQAAIMEADAGDFASDSDVAALAKKWKVNAA